MANIQNGRTIRETKHRKERGKALVYGIGKLKNNHFLALEIHNYLYEKFLSHEGRIHVPPTKMRETLNKLSNSKKEEWYRQASKILRFFKKSWLPYNKFILNNGFGK